MAVTFRILPLLAALLAAGCSLPLGMTSLSQGSVAPPSVAATARLGFSLPHASGRALSVYQATVEPENLVQMIDHYSLTLVSVSGSQTINRTITKAEAANVAVEGLVAAADWSLEVKAWADAGEGTLVGRFFTNTGLSTSVGSMTNLGDLTVAPEAGAGTAPFRIEVTDLPPGLTAGPNDFELSNLAADGTATAASGGDVATVSLTKTQNLLVVQSAGLPTGTYRLVVKLKDNLGQPASFAPLFVINLFPNLTSTKTLTAASWDQPTATGTITAAAPVAGWSALVLAWTTDSPTLFSGYEWVWHPGTAGSNIATANTFNSSFVSPLARSGFLTPAGGSVPLSRPQWTLTTAGGDYAADLTTSSNWTLYVRGVAPGSKTGWIAITVDLSTIAFPLRVNSLDVVSTDGLGTHTLIRTTTDPTAAGVQPTSVPVLNALSFVSPHDGEAQTVTPSAAWYLAPGDFLTMITPTGQYRPIGVFGRPSGPNQTTGFHLYQAIKGGQQGYAAFSQAELAVLGDNRTTDWSVDPKVDNGVGGFTPRGKVYGPKINITGKPYGNLTVSGYQFVGRSGSTLTLESQELGFMTQGEAQDVNFPGALLNTQALSTSADTRHIVVRVQYTLDDGTVVYGPWSNTAADTFWGQMGPDLVVNETNRNLNTGDPSGWDLQLTGTWTDAQESAPGSAPLEYRTKQEGDYDWSGWTAISLGAWNGTGYDWALTHNFATGASGDIQFRVSSADDPVTVYDPLDFAGPSPPLASVMSSGLNDSVGKITYLAADRQNNGWFAQGFTGAGGNVFLSHWFTGGGHDNAWGASGSVITSNWSYFPQGIGFVQTTGTAVATAYPTGYRLWLNGFFNNGIGNIQFSSYDSTGSVDNSGISKAWDHALGRPVIDSTGKISYLGWYGGLNKLWVDQIDSTGTATAFHWEVYDNGLARDDTNHLLQTLAIDADDKILLAGGKRVVRINTDGSTDTTFGSSGWASVNLSDLGTTTDIKAVKVGSGAYAGKIYLLVTPAFDSDIINANLIASKAESTVMRLNSDGSVDTSWGGTGYRTRPGTVVLPPLFLFAKDFDLDADGNIIVVGRTTTGKPYVGALSADGSGPDPTFGYGTADNAYNGFVVLNNGYGGSAESVSITSLGAIGIGGWIKNSPSDDNSTPALWKF